MPFQTYAQEQNIRTGVINCLLSPRLTERKSTNEVLLFHYECEQVLLALNAINKTKTSGK